MDFEDRPYVAPTCDDCGAELLAVDWDDSEGRLCQALECEACR